MPVNIRALIVVAGLSGLVFLWLYQAKVLPVRGQELRRWGVAWLLISCFGFLVPNYWVFMLATGLICLVATSEGPARKLAFYFFLLPAMPLMQQEVPAFGLVNYLIRPELSAVAKLGRSFAVGTVRDDGHEGETCPILADRQIYRRLLLGRVCSVVPVNDPD